MTLLRSRAVLVAFLSMPVALAVLPAGAAPLVYGNTFYAGPISIGSVSDTTANRVSENLMKSVQAIPVSRFDTNMGVLVGANMTVQAHFSDRVTATGSSANPFMNSSVSGSTTSAHSIWMANGLRFEGSNSVNVSCDKSTSTAAPSCPATVTDPYSATYNAVGHNLSFYAGPGAFEVYRSMTVSANLGAISGYGAGSVDLNTTWSATYISMTYSYLEHANASFGTGADSNELVIDFGDVIQNSVLDGIDFSLANLGHDATTGLDLDYVTGSGNTNVLTTNLGAFKNLAAGSSKDFTASLATSALGEFNATYILNLSDADVGEGRRNSQLTLRLRGNVIAAPTNDVPEPAALGLIGLGLIGAASLRRRKA